MKANELRIGNLVYLVDKEKVWEILDGHEIDECDENPLVQPIPLTEHWMFKFGFYQSMAWTYAIELKGNLKLVYYLGEKGWSIGFKSYSDFSNLKYVHQLQNLYFALTGEELTDALNEKAKGELLTKVAKKLTDNQKSIPHDFNQIITENFNDLI